MTLTIFSIIQEPRLCNVIAKILYPGGASGITHADSYLGGDSCLSSQIVDDELGVFWAFTAPQVLLWLTTLSLSPLLS